MRARQLLSRSIQTGYEGGEGTGLSLSQGLLGAGPRVAAPQPLADPCLLVVPAHNTARRGRQAKS